VTNHSGDQPVLGLGIVGLGVAAMSTLPSIVTHPLVRITGVAEPRAEAREKFAQDFDAKGYPSMDEMVRDPAVEAVYITTPHQFHAEQAILAAQHNKHVIMEKPLALSIEDGQAVVSAVERSGIKLIVGHAHSFDPPIVMMREMIAAGDFGRLRMIHTFDYTDFIYRPRRPEELDTDRGGGILFNQTPHMVDVVRLVAGGMVRSVRAYTGVWDPDRPTEGTMSVFLDFEDGTVATLIYAGYGHFDSDELHDWIGEGGQRKDPASYGMARRRLRAATSGEEEAALKATLGYGGPNQAYRPPGSNVEQHHEHFGVLIVSCDRADLKTTPDGFKIYGDEEVREVVAPFGRGGGRRATVVDELYDAVVLDKPLIHDARWALATLEVCTAILESSRRREEVFLSHQTPSRI
jgi:phthalate 4,5-cis-dihydrodiol dehydrogenase